MCLGFVVALRRSKVQLQVEDDKPRTHGSETFVVNSSMLIDSVLPSATVAGSFPLSFGGFGLRFCYTFAWRIV